VLTKITPADIDGSLKSTFGTGGPLLFRSGEQGPIGQAQLAQALTTAYSHPLGAEVQEAAIAWPYTSFGKPTAVVSKTVDAKLGTTTVRFANGTRLLVKPTKYEKDRIQVAVAFGNGRAGVSPELAHKLWETQLYPLGGTGKLSLAQIQHWTQSNGKVATVKFEAGTRAFVLSGTTRPADLLTQMQLLAAYSRDPGFRPEAFEKAKSVGAMIDGQIQGNAGAVFSRGAQALLVGKDPRFQLMPTSSDLANVRPVDLPALLKTSLGERADVVMVGDVSVDDAIKVTEATFGAGAEAKDVTLPAPSVSIQAAAEPVVFEHKGRADQAFYAEYFLLPDYFADPKVSDVADVAAAILQTRLVDTVREKLGMTYSPDVAADNSLELRGQGYFAAMIETPPANFAAFHSLLAEQLKDLATKPVSADELERAKQPLIEAQRKKLETNGYWLAKLTQMTREPRVREQALGQVDHISAVTAADVQALVAKLVVAKQPIVAIARADQSKPNGGQGAAIGMRQ
jgi:zinc protease